MKNYPFAVLVVTLAAAGWVLAQTSQQRPIEAQRVRAENDCRAAAKRRKRGHEAPEDRRLEDLKRGFAECMAAKGYSAR